MVGTPVYEARQCHVLRTADTEGDGAFFQLTAVTPQTQGVSRGTTQYHASRASSLIMRGIACLPDEQFL